MSIDQKIEPAIAAPNPEDDEIDLAELWGTVVASMWMIASVAFIALLLGGIYAWHATPIYESDLLIQVEKKGNTMGDLIEPSLFAGGDAQAETEMEIIRSRSIIGKTVDKLQLDIVAEPNYFPLIGAAIARQHVPADGMAETGFGLSRFAWGGERIAVTRLDVQQGNGKPLTLIAGEKGRFELLDSNMHRILQGTTGTLANSTDQGYSLFVQELVARPGTRFRLSKQRASLAVNALQANLSVAEKGKKTGILKLTLSGPDPEKVANTLNVVASFYTRQNVERHSEEAEKTLAFLEQQLPELKVNLQMAEGELNAYRSKLGSVDVTLEIDAVITRLTGIEGQLFSLNLKRTALLEKFTDKHPAIMAIEQEKNGFEAERKKLNDQIRKMPNEVQQAVRLTRDVKVSDTLYTLLLDKAQELKVIKAGTIGNVRVLDNALIAQGPIKPRKMIILAISLILGLVIGVVLAFIRRALYHGVEDPEQVERAFGLPVYASIPHSEIIRGTQTPRYRFKNKGENKGNQTLTLLNDQDFVLESMRSLRTSLQFALLDASNNVVSVTGPAPSVGKSFISANLSRVIAEAGKRILLIDGDMRKGHLHDYFGLDRKQGLSEVISEGIALDDAIRPTGIDNFYFLPSGILPPNPAELLMNERFDALVKRVSQEYDVVIIDTPPLLAVTDAAIIGRLAGINFVIVRAGMHPIKEIELTVKRLWQNGIRPQGFIFNGVARRPGRYGYGGYGGGYGHGRYAYHYQYSYKGENPTQKRPWWKLI